MTRLETISELLVEELHTFEEQVKKLEKVSKELRDVSIKADSSKIELFIKEHLKTITIRSIEQDATMKNISEKIINAKLYPNWLIILTLLLFLSMAFLIIYLLLFH